MALRKLVYINDLGEPQELNQNEDSIRIKEIELGLKTLTETKLSKLIDGVDAADEHIHDARYFRQDQHIVIRDEEEGAAKPVITDDEGFIDNSFINPSIAGELSHSSMQDLDADDHEQYLHRSGVRPMEGDLDMGTHRITGLANPTVATDAVNKAYADAVAAGLRPKGNVAVATTENLPLLSGLLVIDGYQTVAGDRILVKDQTNKTQNGIYVASAEAWERSIDLDNAPLAEIVNGVLIPRVLNGETNLDRGWFIKSVGTGDDGMHIVGTDDIEFDIFSNPSQLQAGAGVEFNGNVIDIRLLAEGGLKFVNGQIAVEASDIAGEGLVDDGSDKLAIDWSTSFDDSKAIKASDLSSTEEGKGASIIGLADTNGYFSSTNLEDLAAEIYEMLDESGGVKYLADGPVTKGQLVALSGDDEVAVFSDLTQDTPVIGVAFNTAADGAEVKAVNGDFVLTGVLSGAVAGTRYFWSGSALTTSLPTGAGENCYLVGVAKNETDLIVNVKFIKKNA